MSHEISQLDITDRELLEKPRASNWTDIGEAEITHTIFGKAKVRITHKHDKLRRRLLLTATGMAAMSVVVWQGWTAFQPTESLQNAEASPSSSSALEAVGKAPQPGYTLHSATAQEAEAISKSTVSTETSQQSAPQQRQALSPAEKKAAQPVTSQPALAIKPQSEPDTASTIASKNPADLSQPRNQLPPKRAIATVVTTNPTANLAASSAVPVVSPVKEAALNPLPAGDKQSAELVNLQGK